jgi:hypothetical protein
LLGESAAAAVAKPVDLEKLECRNDAVGRFHNDAVGHSHNLREKTKKAVNKALKQEQHRQGAMGLLIYAFQVAYPEGHHSKVGAGEHILVPSWASPK